MKASLFKISNISVVIPSYNRAIDVRETLKVLLKFGKDLNEIIIVDQSKTDEAKMVVESFKNKKIKYLFSRIPSITIARNLGVKKSSKKSKIICFLDDDVTISQSYFPQILKVFNEHPEARAVAGVDDSSYTDAKKQVEIHTIIKKLFFLGHYEKDRARIISSYGNTYPIKLAKTINSEWIPGLNMAYKKEVFKEQQFDENLLGYTVCEDIDFSYRLFKKHPNSLFITPYAKLTHRVSQIEREPTKRLAYINQADHFYFNFKNLNRTLAQKLVFTWSLLGICLLRTLSILSFRKKDYQNFKLFISSLWYCISNLNKIKQGKVREFKI